MRRSESMLSRLSRKLVEMCPATVAATALCTMSAATWLHWLPCALTSSGVRRLTGITSGPPSRSSACMALSAGRSPAGCPSGCPCQKQRSRRMSASCPLLFASPSSSSCC